MFTSSSHKDLGLPVFFYDQDMTVLLNLIAPWFTNGLMWAVTRKDPKWEFWLEELKKNCSKLRFKKKQHMVRMDFGIKI